jgi:hypothetical protein
MFDRRGKRLLDLAIACFLLRDQRQVAFGAKRTCAAAPAGSRPALMTQCRDRPCVARELSSSWRMCGLASMYSAFDWSLLCSGPSWVGHQCSHASGRPILHLVSNPLADLGRSGVSATRVESRCLNLASLEGSPMSQDAPSNAGELVGERDGEDGGPLRDSGESAGAPIGLPRYP